MNQRIPAGGVSKNPFGPEWVSGDSEAASVGEQIQDSLFGKKKPIVLEEDPDVTGLMARLHAYRKKIARIIGDPEDEYRLLLSEGTVMAIDKDGNIYVGRSFLLGSAHNVELQVGVLAHEIGHRPKMWKQYLQDSPRTLGQVRDLCKTEEARADYFAGYALALLGMSADPLCDFLIRAEDRDRPHPEYYPAPVRREGILEGWRDADRQATNTRKFFPEFAAMTSASGDLGIG